jgi:hypothetical protein
MKFQLKLLYAALLIAGLSPLVAQAVVLPILIDTHLAATNAGASVAININPGNKGLLKFNLSTLPAGISSSDIAKATLVFYVKTLPTAGRLQVSPVTKAWSEYSVTTSTAPLEGLPLATSAAISRGEVYVVVDITHLVMNWVDVPSTNFGLMLEPLATTRTSLTIDSKEAAATSHPAYIDVALKGPVGEKGATGLTGSAGINGINGTNGIDGAPGTKGDIGPQGPAGTSPVGHAAGDMQYWDGTAWVNVPAGLFNTTLKNCHGIPAWVVSSCPLQIGDNGPAGGKVFYITDATGLHGLEAAPVDQASSAWGCQGTSIPGTDAAIGTGAANTAKIVTGCSDANTAAKIANAYSLNGFTDWYLPSKDELNLLYGQKTVVGGFASNLYWSSTENDSSNAWSNFFANGLQDYNNKFAALPVRAIRAF